jgi:hypothetical protein
MHSRANPGQVSQNETLTPMFPEREGESAGEKRKRELFLELRDERGISF